MDGRFWSGAAVAITVVIAGATSLPALLLRAPAEAPVATAVVPAKAEAPRPTVAQPVVAPPPETRTEPTTVTATAALSGVVLPPATPSLPPAAALVVAAAPTATPAPTAPTGAAPEPAAPPPSAVAAIGFPPVQPLMIEPEAAPPSAPAALAASPAKPAPAQAPRTKAAAHEGKERKHLRPVRPAIYPLREFLAWRR
jgi:hypothetical protein